MHPCTNHSACSVGWFVSLLVYLRVREVLLTGSGEQYSCEGAGQPSQPQPAQRSGGLRFQEAGVPRVDICPLEVPDEDPLEVRPVADAVVWKEFKPCPNMFAHANGKVLDDEQASRKSLSQMSGFDSPVYLVMLEGGQKRCGNGALWMRRLKAHGLGPSGLGLRSSDR